jgi:hypothetical protein
MARKTSRGLAWIGALSLLSLAAGDRALPSTRCFSPASCAFLEEVEELAAHTEKQISFEKSVLAFNEKSARKISEDYHLVRGSQVAALVVAAIYGGLLLAPVVPAAIGGEMEAWLIIATLLQPVDYLATIGRSAYDQKLHAPMTGELPVAAFELVRALMNSDRDPGQGAHAVIMDEISSPSRRHMLEARLRMDKREKELFTQAWLDQLTPVQKDGLAALVLQKLLEKFRADRDRLWVPHQKLVDISTRISKEKAAADPNGFFAGVKDFVVDGAARQLAYAEAMLELGRQHLYLYEEHDRRYVQSTLEYVRGLCASEDALFTT